MRESNNNLLTGLDAENTDVEYHELEGGDFKDLIINPINRVKALSKGIRNDYPPVVRKALEKIGTKEIRGIRLFRQDLSKGTDIAMNITSLGQWDKEKKRLGYDKFFHLGMILTLENGEEWVLDKHAVIKLHRAPPLHIMAKDYSNTHTVNMGNKSPSVGELLKKTQRIQGDRYFKYNPFDNNCQNFVINTLSANGLLDESSKKFGLQEQPKNLGRFTEKLAPRITDLGGLADVAIEGEGFAGGKLADDLAEPPVITHLARDGYPQFNVDEGEGRGLIFDMIHNNGADDMPKERTDANNNSHFKIGNNYYRLTDENDIPIYKQWKDNYLDMNPQPYIPPVGQDNYGEYVGRGFAGGGFETYSDMSGVHSDMLGGAGLNFMDSFKPATFKRSFNSAMDLLSTPAKIATTLTGTGKIINPLLDARLKHDGRVSSMFRTNPPKEVVVRKDTTDEQKKKLMAHSEHHSREHMTMMNKAMMDGKTFDEAHQLAQKLVGR